MENIELTFDQPLLPIGVEANSVPFKSELERVGSNENLTNSSFQSPLTTQELVFVDPSVEDYQNLIAEVASSATVVLLDSTKDGITQISEVLVQYTNLSALHLVSHGGQGNLQLGTAQLSLDNLELYQDELMGWAGSLADEADILLYGCDVAAGDRGSDFVNEFSSLTGADVAASNDLTGSSALGGDGDLEYTTGNIEADLAFESDAIENWDFLLANDYVVQTDPNFQKETVLSGLNEPIDLAFLPDGNMLFLQKGGIIQIVDPNTNNPTPSIYLDISNRIKGGAEAGLLSIELDPEFATNNYLYIYYSDKGGIGDADDEYRITRFTHNETTNTAEPNSESVVYRKPGPVRGHHDGGGLSFGPDGKIYLTIGDHEPSRTPDPTWDASQVQDLTFPYGKILRINKDGTIPQDNPYVDGPGGNLDEIWAVGLRNPYRANWDGESGRFFIGDVGGNVQSTAREEINLGQAGANYGWPDVEGVTGDPTLTDPLFDYGHTGSTPNGGAVTAGIVYRGNQFPSEYNGSFFFGDYVLGWIRYLQFDASGNVIDADPSTPEVDAFNFDNSAGTVVAIEQAPDGSLYYAELAENFSGPGNISRITYNTSNQLPIIQSAGSDLTEGPVGSTFNFTASATDGDNDPLTYTWSFGDGTTATGADVSHTYNTAGAFTASVQVSDGTGNVNSDPITIQVGSRPDAVIDAPLDGSLFRAGDQIQISASATDLDGTITESNFVWDVDFVHNAHTHPEDDIIGTSSFTFDIPTTGHGYSDTTGYKFELTVTDSDGLTDVETITIVPEKVDLTFASNVPGDITYTVDGVSRTGSFILDQAINFEHTIGVKDEVILVDGTEYTFDSWSNGIDPPITTPTFSLTVPDENRTYTANYIVTNTSVNNPPTATDDSFAIDGDSSDNQLDVLANDSDPDTGDILTITAVTQPDALTGGSVAINATNDGLIYTPAAGFTGDETFTYTISDGNGGTATATVTATVGAANSGPLPSGLVLHLDANQGVTTDGTDLVTGWTDQSGLGNDLTGSGDPRLVSGALNGQDVIRFDGAGDKLERILANGLPTGNDDRTVFMVAKYNNNNGGAGGFVYGKTSKGQAFGLMVDNEGELGIQGWYANQDLRTNEVGVGTGWLTQSAVLNAGEAILYKDGTAIGTKNPTWNTTLDRIMIGAEFDNNPYLDMEVATVLVFDRALSDAERQQVEDYLQQKYFGNSAQ